MSKKQQGAWIPRSLKWVGISTLILVIPGGLIAWGAQFLIRRKYLRTKVHEQHLDAQNRQNSIPSSAFIKHDAVLVEPHNALPATVAAPLASTPERVAS